MDEALFGNQEKLESALKEKPWNYANQGCGYLVSAVMRDACVTTTDESWQY
jgi:hypothetical protein